MDTLGTVQVRFMGDFELSIHGDVVDLDLDSGSKSAELLAILLFYSDHGISKEKLIKCLYQESDADPTNSLKALMFRLRKRLKSMPFPEMDFIIFQNGTYRFNEALKVDSDVQNLRDIIKVAALANEEGEKAEQLKKACNCYRGELLPALSTELWVVLENASLIDQVMKAAHELDQYYQKKRDYRNSYLLNKRMSEVLPFDEKWYVARINALISMGSFQKALDEYTTVSAMLFDEMGIYPSEELIECARNIGRKIILPDTTAEDVKSSLKESVSSGAYYCNYPSFVDGYHIVRRIMDRDGIKTCLLLCTLMGRKQAPVKDQKQLSSAIQKLGLALGCALRKSDMYTRYSLTRMLVMLWDCPPENADASIHRIDAAYHSLTGDNYPVQVSYSVLDGNKPLTPSNTAKLKPGNIKWKPLPSKNKKEK